MAIFSRRTIQRMLVENSAFLTDGQLQDHTARLNRNDLQAFDAEWEVAVLNAFSKVGNVQHELDLVGKSKLDIAFVPDAEKTASFAADITTVSDDGFEEKSPVNHLYIELSTRLRDIKTGGFNIRIGSERPKIFGGLPKISLPPRGEFSKEIFNSKFRAFMSRIKANPNKSDLYEVRTDRTDFHLSYHPGRRTTSSSWAAYKVAEKKDKNPIFNALKAKQKQLKNSGYTGHRGVILCDGGTDMFSAGQHSSFEFFYNATDAIHDFLRQYKSIDFVLAVSSVWTKDHSPFDKTPVRQIQVKVYGNESYPGLPIAIRESLEKVEDFFPEPDNTPGGARDTIKLGYDPKEIRPMATGLRCSDREVSVYASTVLTLMAGSITHDEFEKALGFQPSEFGSPAIRNMFAAMLDRKMRISEVVVEDTAHDDSWLTFKFAGPDPAISDFVAPKSKKPV